MTVVPLVLALASTVLGVALFVRAVMRIVGVMKLGQPTLGRTDAAGNRWKVLLIESLGHTRMLKLSGVGAAHWIVLIGFMYLFTTLVNAYGQIFNPSFALPLIGHFFLYEWVLEGIAWIMTVAICFLILNRLVLVGNGKGRFTGSRSWMALYVEFTILAIGICVLALRGLEFGLFRAQGAESATPFHFPLTSFLAPNASVEALETAIIWVAAIKILVSMAWFCVISLNLTMGVAWHRFTAWPNIWFKRHADGTVALGELDPVNVGGKPLDFEELEDLDEDAALGAGKIEDFSWKGLLDFTSCTECGRCQSQCPAWNTEKPLSPKLLMMGLREHTFAKVPWLQAAEEARGGLPKEAQTEGERPLVGATVTEGADEAAVRQQALAQAAHNNPIQIGDDGIAAVVDPDVLWSCTSCGACVEQCPVDIEHVDHIMDMRRFQVMIENEFPEELNGLYKGLESKGNPWNLNKKGRLDWTKGLDFDVPVVGKDVDDLNEVEYLFWVGCAGAFEDRAKKTTQAVAELLHTAGVTYAILGKNETCTGDSARRSGNEFIYQQLAGENVATLTEAEAKKVVTTCAHCLNTLKNEYPQLGLTMEVVHHTQLLNRLVREGKLKPAPDAAGANRTITYHDPCYIGRHNRIYEPPRELLGSIPGATVAEMPRNRSTSFCCGAGGARMWMEETIGTRINMNRTEEALTVLNNQENSAIAVGCPFCRVMLADGVTAKQQDGQAENVEVLDVAQLLLEAVRRGQPQESGDEAAPLPEDEVGSTAEPAAGEPEATSEPTATTDGAGPNEAEVNAEDAPSDASETETGETDAIDSQADPTDGDEGTKPNG